MKILKYLFLLLILAIFGLSVFIATQKGTVELQKSTFIKVPRNVVFDYVNQYRNWELWASWKEDDNTMKFIYPDNTAGIAASFQWNGDKGAGKIATISLVDNHKIDMKTDFDGNEFDAVLNLKDSVGGTKVVWKIKGNVDFLTKISASFSGGVKGMIGNIFERSLNNLNVVLTNEINNFSLSDASMISIPARYFVKSTVICKPSEMQAKISASLPKLEFFFKYNNVKMNGKPFIIKEFQNEDTLKLGVYGPLKEEIFISAGSDLTAGYMESFTALKIVLKGDYSHITAAKAKATLEFNKRQLRPSATILPMEVYFRTILDSNKPSQWLTSIQIPVYSKPLVAPKTFRPKPKKVEILEPEPEVPPSEKGEF